MQKSSTLSDLISPEYLAEQQRLHADPRGYGGRGDKWAEVVAGLIEKGRAGRVLDYGCGQGKLRDAVRTAFGISGGGFLWVNYDPAIKGIDQPPTRPFDLVVSTDVLEHIEPEKIDNVVRHLRALVAQDGQLFTVISLVETAKTLSDGRQAHILLADRMWWQRKMEEHGLMWDGETYPNPKPEKQFVATWRPL